MALCWKKSSLVSARVLPRLGSVCSIFSFHREIAAVGVAEEYQAHHRQEVFIAGVVGVGPQVVGGTPEACFNGFDVFELRHVGCGSRYVAVVSVRLLGSVRAAIANAPELQISGPHSNLSVFVPAAYMRTVRGLCPAVSL